MKFSQDWQFETDSSPITHSKTMTMITLLSYLACLNLAVIVTAPLFRYYLNTPGFLTFRVMMIAIIIGVVLMVTTIFLSAFLTLTKTYISWRPVILIVILGMIPVLTAVILVGIDNFTKPLTHDISTDVDDPPLYQETINLRQPGDNSTAYMKDVTASKQLAAYPEIKPLITELSVDDALVEATQVVKDLQWEFINLDYQQGIIEAYDTSTLFGFIDDIVIRVRQEGSGSRIDIRSSSRVGKGDLGKNAERISQFIQTFRS